MLAYSRLTIVASLAIAFSAMLPIGFARAGDLPVKAADKVVKKTPDLPFFLVTDNRVTFSWMPSGTDPWVFSLRPDGSINGKTAMQVYSFTHFDLWAYGTNLFQISMFKSDHNDPANPCVNNGVPFDPATGAPVLTGCAGATTFFGFFRSTFGWNELFNTKAFTAGPLHNVSFEVGMDAGNNNTHRAPEERAVTAGLQFAFDLPYHGYFNVAPLARWEFVMHSAFAQCGSGWVGTVPGVSCIADGNISYNPTWAVETNYYMDLGFLPENMQFWSISGRAAWYGKKGSENGILPGTPTTVEFNSEPIRLTFDASKAVLGPKYSHFVDLWVAYRYWQNMYGFDNKLSVYCNAAPGVSNHSCTQSTVYAGITAKF